MAQETIGQIRSDSQRRLSKLALMATKGSGVCGGSTLLELAARGGQRMGEKPRELVGRADPGGPRRRSKLTWPTLFEG